MPARLGDRPRCRPGSRLRRDQQTRRQPHAHLGPFLGPPTHALANLVAQSRVQQQDAQHQLMNRRQRVEGGADFETFLRERRSSHVKPTGILRLVLAPRLSPSKKVVKQSAAKEPIAMRSVVGCCRDSRLKSLSTSQGQRACSAASNTWICDRCEGWAGALRLRKTKSSKKKCPLPESNQRPLVY